MSEVLRGYDVVSLCGLAVFPLVHRSLRALPDRGYSVCRCFGWVAASWVAWTAAWLSGRPLSTPVALGALILVGATCWAPRLLRRTWRAPERTSQEGPLSFLRRNLGIVACVEALFLSGCLLFGALQARNPAVDPDSERFMDCAFLRATLRSPGLPVPDPWFAGEPASYYHFGYALVAFLVRAGGADPARFFTTAVALPYALLWIGSFGAALALARRARAAAWSAFLVLGAGNFAWLRQGARAFRPGSFDWFSPSRAIEGTITEFPWFSLLWGDLHPYAITLPIVACGLTFAMAEALESRSQAEVRPIGFPWQSAGRAIGFALVCGAVLAAHPWDFPFLLAASIALILAGGARGKAARATALGVSGLLSVGLYLPFVRHLPSGARGLGRVVAHSAPAEWIAAYGPFALLAILAAPLVRAGVRRKQDEGVWRQAVVLAGCALGIALLGEVVYVRDLFESTPLSRMNTVFKLHRLAWLLFALATAPLAERLLSAGENPVERRAGLWRAAGRAVLTAVALPALVYPVLGTGAWLRARRSEMSRQPEGPARAALAPGADAEALFRALRPGDAAAASFIAHSAGARDALLEETGDPYSWSSRIATFSGVPTVLGWGNHEAVWRQGWDEVLRRGADVASIYASPGSPATCERLRSYGVTWIVVGERERDHYGDAVSGFGRLARPLVAIDGTEVYAAADVCPGGAPSGGGARSGDVDPVTGENRDGRAPP